MEISELQKLRLPKGARLGYLIAAVIGAVTFTMGVKLAPDRAWASFLTSYYFWLCVSLSGVFFVALQHITGSAWSVAIRRIPETFMAYLPIALILFVVLALCGSHTLYEWTHYHVVENDLLLREKSGYLNIPFFMIRNILLIVVCCGVGYWFLTSSLRQDRTGDVRLTKKSTYLSAPFLLVFAWGFSFVSFDLIMSLAPHWFSTIFGVYCWSILFLSGVALTTIIAIVLKKRGILEGVVNENHLHDLGKLLFAFTVFWTYIAFSQFMLIWYANLPEETPYMLLRTQGAWKKISLALIVVKFAIPFFALISRHAKRSENFLLLMAVWILLAQWLDIYWLVYPTFFKAPVFGWLEIGTFIGFAGLFFLCVGTVITRVRPFPIKDPRLAESLHHHQ